MPQEFTFRSPNIYEREIDQSQPTSTGPVGVPAGVIGTANKGPAFVPVTVANFNDFIQVFGDLDTKRFGPYAANEFLKHKAALTYLRVLGAGANSGSSDITATQTSGRVINAGFKLVGSAATGDTLGRHQGVVQFITAQHDLQANEAFGMPMFTDNDSYVGSSVNLVRGLVMMASGARLEVLGGSTSAVGAFAAATPGDSATVASGKVKLVISSALGTSFASTDGNPGIKILTASLDPSNDDYFGKVLNRDPDRFVAEQHILYVDFAVDDEIATATTVAILSGSSKTSTSSGETTTVMRQAFGAYDTRYTTPKTTWFISQPFGVTEYDLFHFEALDDGEFANKLYKISISNIKASTDESDRYGTFTVEIRDYNDTDVNPQVLERYPACSLNPVSDHYVAKLVGDRKVTYNFDTTVETERRIITSGKYPNVSSLVRIVMHDDVEKAIVPNTSLPFGFRGIETLKTNDSLTDTPPSVTNKRLTGVFTLGPGAISALSGAIVPPVPFRYKVTKGTILDTAAFEGEPGPTELTNNSLYWGVKFERNNSPLNANASAEKNELINSLTKFIGIEKLDVLVTGSGADTFNNNKFTLARVALSNTALTDITSSLSTHMREAAYMRNAKLDLSKYTINDSMGNRLTLATILATDTAANFNRFSPYAKFSTFMYGGYDGLNILDRDARRMNDKATSMDAGGGAETSYVSPGLASNVNGTGQANSNVASYKAAINIMTDPMAVNTNVLVIPGIRETYITDYAAEKSRDYGLAFYVLDVPGFDENSTRLYDDDTTRPDVDETASQFESRVIDNNYAGSYFPDVTIEDLKNNRRVKVPSSVAVLGALAFNDKIAYPWFAPAGFNRAALDFVTNVDVRLNVTDRDRLQDARINPIATFPRLGFVIYGQKTLQIKKSALDRINVRRLLLDIKRIVIGIAQKLVFEQNTADVRANFVKDVNQQLGLIQALSGIERFEVVCNETNNTSEDINLNKLNGRVVIVPTRSIEFIDLSFVITNNGISFV